MKKSGVFEKVPAPISLSRKPHSKGGLDSNATPYRMEWGSAPLRNIENNASKPSLGNMKQELSYIKLDVEKLVNGEESLMSSRAREDPVIKALRAELQYQQELQENLRRQIRELKAKLSQEKLIREERQIFERRIEQLKKQWRIQRNTLKSVQDELNSQIQRLKEEKNKLTSDLQEVQTELKKNQQEHESIIREKDAKYENALKQFKKLEIRFDKSTQDNVLTLTHKLLQTQQELSNSKILNQDLSRRANQNRVRIERLAQQLNQSRIRCHQLEDIARKNRTDDYTKQIDTLKSKIQEYQNYREALLTNYRQKCAECDQLKVTIQQSNSLSLHQEAHRLRGANFDISMELQRIRNDCAYFQGHVQYLQQILREKEEYIQALEDSTPENSSAKLVRQLEERCQLLMEEKNSIVRNYESALKTLQQSNTRNRSSSMTSSCHSRSNSTNNFDQILRDQLRQNEQLKIALNSCTEENHSLKIVNEQYRRRLELIRSQYDVERIRTSNENKNSQAALQSAVQQLKQDLQNATLRKSSTEKMLEYKNQEIKKKDEFIRNCIIGKIGKQDTQTDVQYLTKQLERFVTLNKQ